MPRTNANTPPAPWPGGTREELRRVQRELDTARAHFDMTADSDLIDCCIHQMIALEKRYSFLLRQLRGPAPAEKGLTPAAGCDRMEPTTTEPDAGRCSPPCGVTR